MVRADATHARAEAGFSLLEIIVVLVIIGIMLAVGFASMRGSHARANSAKAKSVAIQLGEAIQQFQRDHGGRPPGQPGTVDWGNRWVSPVDRGNGNKPYVSGTSVDALATNAVSLETTAGAAGPGASAIARIRYYENPAANLYALVVYINRDGTRRPVCWVSGGDASSVGTLIGSRAVHEC